MTCIIALAVKGYHFELVEKKTSGVAEKALHLRTICKLLLNKRCLRAVMLLFVPIILLKPLERSPICFLHEENLDKGYQQGQNYKRGEIKRGINCMYQSTALILINFIK